MGFFFFFVHKCVSSIEAVLVYKQDKSVKTCMECVVISAPSSYSESRSARRFFSWQLLTRMQTWITFLISPLWFFSPFFPFDCETKPFQKDKPDLSLPPHQGTVSAVTRSMSFRLGRVFTIILLRLRKQCRVKEPLFFLMKSAGCCRLI